MTHTNSEGLAAISEPTGAGGATEAKKSTYQQATLRLELVDCSASAARIEKAMLGLAGTASAYVNLATSQLHLHYDAAVLTQKEIEAALNKIGAPVATEDSFNKKSSIQQRRSRKLVLSAVLSVLCWLPLVLNWLTVDIQIPVETLCLLATICQFYLGARLYRGALWSVTTGHANIDLTTALATSLAYFYSLYLWLVTGSDELYFHINTLMITLALFSKWTKHQAMYHAASKLEPLLNLTVPVAHKWLEDKLITIAVNRLNPGDEIEAHAGELIAADGYVVAGVSSVDESLLTGLQGATPKQHSDYVLAGSRNLNDGLRIRVTKRAEDFQLHQTTRYLIDAQAHHPKTQKQFDKTSLIYMLLVTVAAAASYGYHGYVADVQTALTAVMAVLLIACPCALSIAAPYAFVIASNLGVQRGVLFRNLRQLQGLAKADKLVFSNSGTLTTGQHQVVKLEQWTKNEQWQAAAKKVMQQSRHPIAEAALAYLNKVEPIKLDFNWVNQGAMGTLARRNSVSFIIGSDDLLIDQNIPIKPVHLRNSEPDQGRLWVVANGSIIARFDLKDRIRDMAHETIDTLRQQGFEFSLFKSGLTGASKAIASSLGIRNVENNLSDDAVSADSKNVFIGNGLRDSDELLESAGASIVLGRKENAAIGRGGINLMRQDISLVYEAIQIARRTHRVIRRNVLISVSYNSIAIPLAALGYISPVPAGVLAVAISLALLLHSHRLQKWQPVPVRPMPGNPMEAD
ncbi:heavy metal translocating P-type ATPase [Reinekea marinisedimentorum]|uniref:Cu+-exporting ATPase n=1 Tax=Reinekea marinisedimentorum TaxID=230495 RepID=A0A4R3HX02_9GAMM|nr:HAD-IC family P-type ATPase [Reinekea marinisedimentorum]TCS37678.1 Cu+-exporting ATPase [Reinekea marinisedimentorum]